MDIEPYMLQIFIASILVSPTRPGLTYEEIITLGKQDDYGPGEIKDEIKKITNYREDGLILNIDFLEHYIGSVDVDFIPEFRNLTAMDRIHKYFFDQRKELGIDNLGATRQILVEDSRSHGIKECDMEVAITCMLIGNVLTEQNGTIRPNFVSKELHSSKVNRVRRLDWKVGKVANLADRIRSLRGASKQNVAFEINTSMTTTVTSGVSSGRAAKIASTNRTLNILFLDLAGWSKLSAAQITTYLEKALPKLAAKIGEFRSDHLNTWGDAVVAAFSSATDAANCALDIRDLFRRATETDGVPRGLVPRISLHVGDVIIAHNPLINRNDIFGDAVHLAARLEPVTARGQVFCTEEFAKSLSGLVGTAPVAHAHTEVDLPKGFGRIKVFAVTGPNEEPPVAQTGQ